MEFRPFGPWSLDIFELGVGLIFLSLSETLSETFVGMKAVSEV